MQTVVDEYALRHYKLDPESKRYLDAQKDLLLDFLGTNEARSPVFQPLSSTCARASN